MKLASMTPRSTKRIVGQRVQIADVGPFQRHYPLIAAQLPGQLTIAHIHGKDTRNAPLQQTVGEAACARAHVNSRKTGHVQSKIVQRSSQLETAAAHVLGQMAHTDGRIDRHSSCPVCR